MLRFLMTHGLPGQSDNTSRAYRWEFRRPDETARWQVSVPTSRIRRAPRRPEQARWLQDAGFPAPGPDGVIPLSEGEIDRLLGLIEPHTERSWAAFEAFDARARSIAAGNMSAAFEHSLKLLRAAPEWLEARLQHVWLLVVHERDADAAQSELDAIAASADRKEVRKLRQSIALLRDDWDAYATHQQEIVDEGERNPWDWETLGLSYWAAGNLQGGLDAIHRGLGDHPGNRDLAHRAAELMDALGQTDDAIAYLTDLIAADPTHPKSWALRGWVRRARAPDLAAADYRAALEIDPDQPVARVGRGLQRLDAGDRDGAREDLKPFAHCGWQGAAD
ncbi:MAG: tetratricopeptide repeat protein, partial [Myxococcota bacterium]